MHRFVFVYYKYTLYNLYMPIEQNNKPVHKRYRLEKYLIEKRTELIWALSLQEYTNAQIARIFRLDEENTIYIIKQKPKDWLPKWIKKDG